MTVITGSTNSKQTQINWLDIQGIPSGLIFNQSGIPTSGTSLPTTNLSAYQSVGFRRGSETGLWFYQPSRSKWEYSEITTVEYSKSGSTNLSVGDLLGSPLQDVSSGQVPIQGAPAGAGLYIKHAQLSCITTQGADASWNIEFVLSPQELSSSVATIAFLNTHSRAVHPKQFFRRDNLYQQIQLLEPLVLRVSSLVGNGLSLTSPRVKLAFCWMI